MFLFCFELQVTEDEKVSRVKELVSDRLNIPPNQQRLLYKGKALAGVVQNDLNTPSATFIVNVSDCELNEDWKQIH